MSRRACQTSTCNAILRVGNPGPFCGPCERSAREQARAQATATGTDRSQTILELLARRPMTTGELCAAMVATDKDVRQLVFDLIAAGKVERAPKHGGYRHYRLAVDAEALMAEAS